MTAMMAAALLQSHSWTIQLRTGCCVSCGGLYMHVTCGQNVYILTA